MWWAYLLSALAGGLLAIVALIIALAIVSRGGHEVSIQFGGTKVAFYKNMELIESAVRPGGIYVEYKNTGDKLATSAVFRIRVFGPDGRLLAESEEVASDEVAPGQVQENVLVSHRLEEWVHDPDNRIEVTFRYGYLE